MNGNKLLFTGGHLTPALAVIEKILHTDKTKEIIFVGRKYAMEDDVIPSEEYRVITSLQIRFLPLITGRLRRYMSGRTILSILKLPVGMIQAFYYCFREQPDVIVSFGGYIALPVVFAGWLLGIPSITHEQSHKIGLANRIISLFAKRICLTWPISYKYDSSEKIVITGLPIREAILKPPDKSSFAVDNNYPLLYIQGGITGSNTVNRLIFPLIPDLIKRFVVIHQTGRRWLEQGITVKNTLPVKAKNRYIPLPYLETSDHAWILHKAHLVIARSGANSVVELAATANVAILIPLAIRGSDQTDNARFLADTGAAIVVDEERVTSQVLYDLIQDVENRYLTLKQNALTINIANGTDRLLNVISAVAQKKPYIH